jgi:hypothetical protein
MLAVDGEHEAPSPLLGGQRELAGGDEALLVREREGDAALERPQRRGQAREADDRVQDDVGLRTVEQLREVASDLSQRREPVDGLRAGGCGDELEIGVALDDLDGLTADRAGRPQQGYTFHSIEVYGGVRRMD